MKLLLFDFNASKKVKNVFKHDIDERTYVKW